MNKKRIVVASIIGFIVIGISFSALASRNLLQYTNNGELIVYANEQIPEDIEVGTPMVLALPNVSEKSPDEIQKEEKEAFAQMHSDLQNEVIERNEILTFSAEENENVDEPFVTVLKKYFGNDEIESIYLKIFKESSDEFVDGDVKPLTNSQKEILEKTLELISSTKTTTEEKDILKEALNEEVSSISDEKFVEKINNVLQKQ